ncbi:iron chelate uptake ABC transporter family permease subunit [Streptomyces nogalater]|uniref:iron chelate uptake ABC transporter family permease subunit n=1 Tax=Streptomyces nogalater TaxID=38314 RepID=UPI003CD06F39
MPSDGVRHRSILTCTSGDRRGDVRLRRLVLPGAGTGLTAPAVAAAGPVPFVAMAAPQLARRLTRAAGPDIPPAAWMGALLLTAADLATQPLTGSPLLPVGVLTGVAGGAYLAWLLRGERRGARL